MPSVYVRLTYILCYYNFVRYNDYYLLKICDNVREAVHTTNDL
jgi:hypothetical protein